MFYSELIPATSVLLVKAEGVLVVGILYKVFSIEHGTHRAATCNISSTDRCRLMVGILYKTFFHRVFLSLSCYLQNEFFS